MWESLTRPACAKIITDATRDHRPARPLPRPGLGAALAAVLLAGAPSVQSPDTAPGAVAPSGAYPVTIEHRYGATEISTEPQRVVVVGLIEQDAMLALGTVPVATSNVLDVDGGIFPWAEAALGSPTPVPLDQTDGIPYEKVAELGPDLIVGLYSGLTDEQYANLSTITPTVAQPAGWSRSCRPRSTVTRPPRRSDRR